MPFALCYTVVKGGDIYMDWIQRMNNAMEYIEQHLQDKMDYEALAQSACCSAYHFQRMFSAIADIPLSEYIRRRKMTAAAFELQSCDVKVVDVALKFGYDSPEAFTRAFTQMHGITPSNARKAGVVIKAYPRMSFQLTIKGDTEMNYRIVQKPAFQLYGIERIFDTKDGKNLIDVPNFWQEIMSNGEFEKLAKSCDFPSTAQAICDYRPIGGEQFVYMIGCMKTPLSNTDGYTVVDIPASTWAIFKNEPHTIEETSKETQSLIRRIYTDWLPTANYDKVDSFELELYYDTTDGRFYEEAWVRVQPKA